LGAKVVKKELIFLLSSVDRKGNFLVNKKLGVVALNYLEIQEIEPSAPAPEDLSQLKGNFS
jgi:hypothetical protein